MLSCSDPVEYFILPAVPVAVSNSTVTGIDAARDNTSARTALPAFSETV